jgi:signal transduction histidine kinase
VEGYDSRRLRKDNSQMEVSVWNAPVRNIQGEVVANVGILADNTERKRTQEELMSINRRLRELSGRLLDVQEDERRSIARELHDEIGQQLTALRFMLEGLERPPSRSAGDGSLVFGDSISVTHNTQHTTPVAKRLDSALTILDNVTARVREMSLNLRPSMLDDAGLAPGLLWHAQRYTAQTGIEVDLAHRGLEERLPAAVETAIYRIIQEALTNVARHADVQHVTVQIMVARGPVQAAESSRPRGHPAHTPLAGNVTVLIEDLGNGFDLSKVLAGHTSTGLSGMRERAELLGGQLIIESHPGAGTRIMAEMPLVVDS